MCNDRCQHVGYGFCHVDSPDSYEVGEDEGQGEQEEELAHDSEYEGIPGVPKGYEGILVHHLQSKYDDRAEHDAHGDGGEADQLCVAGEHAADLSREGYQAEPHKCGTANAQDSGVVYGFLDPAIVPGSQVVAEDWLGACDDADQGHEEYLADAGQEGHGGNVQVAFVPAVTD